MQEGEKIFMQEDEEAFAKKLFFLQLRAKQWKGMRNLHENREIDAVFDFTGQHSGGGAAEN